MSANRRSPGKWVSYDGLEGLMRNWHSDLAVGFTIFLIALPLSLGIAIASGAPPTAGIIAAVVGGVLGSLVSGSYLTINGPAAGLIVIMLGAVHDLGGGDAAAGFRRTLATILIAGAIQVGLGLFRVGVLGTVVPGSVIHGMLTAIGVIIFAKQIPVALGVTPLAKDPVGLLLSIPQSIANVNPEVALIAAVGFILLLSFKQFQGQWTRFVPAPLAVVVAGWYLARVFDFDHAHLVTSHWLKMEVGPNQLLNVPSNLANAIIPPDFGRIWEPVSWRYIISFALVGSIESLLTANAIDRMDPYRRVSNLDRELIGKGLCNILCGAIGGLPIIAEIVRSSANVRGGAKTRWSCFFHGVLIFVFLALFPQLLHEIPLSALASILMSVGFLLGHPSQFLRTAQVGGDHFFAFVTTFAVTLVSDLLLGVLSGIIVELLFNLVRGTSFGNLFRPAMDEVVDESERRIVINSALVFSNFLALKRKLESISGSPSVVLDLIRAPLVDHTVLEHLHRHEAEQSAQGHRFHLSFSEHHRAVSRHPLAARRKRKHTG